MANEALIICGAAPDTGNLGVSALLYSTIAGVAARSPESSMAILDHGRGSRQIAMPAALGAGEVECYGAYRTKRFWRAESWIRIRASARARQPANPAARLFLRAKAVLDVSGGDSFTDLYGAQRFATVMAPKLLTLQLKRPLVLLPQTYGPFSSGTSREQAASVVRRARVAWARDECSFAVLRDLAGKDFDPEHHRCGVDMAFNLPHYLPTELSDAVLSLLEDKKCPRIGLNVSGLLWNDPQSARTRYGLRADYRETVTSFMRRILDETDARVLLIPHVVTPRGHFESDLDACEGAREQAGASGDSRVVIAPMLSDPCEIKGIVARLDWFCGMRMHSTIAALSSGVPAAAIAYSPKTLGVFKCCGLDACVVDPRELETDDVVARLWECWERRAESKHRLEEQLAWVKATAAGQMDQIVAACGVANGDTESSSPCTISREAS